MKKFRYVFASLAGLSIIAAFGACGEAEAPAEAEAGADASLDVSSDWSSSSDARIEGDSTVDAGGSDASDAGDASDGSAAYHDFTNPTYWSQFDSTSVDAGAAGYWGGTFDGRYVYMPSYHNVYGWDGVVTRYDTQSPFGSGASWSLYNTKSVNAAIGGFYGAGFDGRYVYLVPPASGPSGIVARYDTQVTFTENASWTTFDTTSVNSAAKGFVGSVFDGRYLYLVPYSNGITSYNGTVTRYDTQASFTSTGSWATFNTRSLTTSASGFFGGVFDGRYVYFVPDGNNGTGTVTRYDTQGSFSAAGSWTTFDARSLHADAKGFQTAAFDGRYIYLVPGHASDSTAFVVRYDTTADFGVNSSWKHFDTTTVNASAKGFSGAAFDGRYVYLVPHVTGGSPAFSGLLVRYDTLSLFDNAPSWTTFDLTTLNAAAAGFQGAVFDGHYLYLVPSVNAGGYSGLVMRFDAKSPPATPSLPAFHGSFL